MSKIDPVIATHDNEPSSQLEAEIGDNEEEDVILISLVSLIKQHNMSNLVIFVMFFPLLQPSNKANVRQNIQQIYMKWFTMRHLDANQQGNIVVG